MVIQHNIPALNSHRNLGLNNAATSKNLEKLSSGYKINRAGDDAAGLAISEKMRGQIRGLGMAEQNANNGISLIQTAEGGLNETHSILQRMRELAVQSSNATYQDEDRLQIEKEFQALKSEIDRIAQSTHYNGIKLLDGTTGGVELKHGAPVGIALDPATALADMGVAVTTSKVTNNGTIGTPGTAITATDTTGIGFANDFTSFDEADITATKGDQSFGGITNGVAAVTLTYAGGGNWTVSSSSTNTALDSAAVTFAGGVLKFVDTVGDGSAEFEIDLGSFTPPVAPADLANGTTVSFDMDITTVANGSSASAMTIDNVVINGTYDDGATTNVDAGTADLNFRWNATDGAWDVTGSATVKAGATEEKVNVTAFQIVADGTDTQTITLTLENGSEVEVELAGADFAAPTTTNDLLSGSFSASVNIATGAVATSGAKGMEEDPTAPALTRDQQRAQEMLTQMGLTGTSALTLQDQSGVFNGSDYKTDFNGKDAYIQVRPKSDMSVPEREIVLQIGDETFHGKVNTDDNTQIDFFKTVYTDDTKTTSKEILVATLSDTNHAVLATSASSNGTVSFNIRHDATAYDANGMATGYGDGTAITAIRGSKIATEADSSLQFQIGANGGADQRVGLFVANMSSMNIGLIGEANRNEIGNLRSEFVYTTSVATRDLANQAIEVLNGAIVQVAGQRAELGALQNRLEHTLNNLGVTKENLTAAESSIRDVDMAKEMMEFTKNNILVQASQAMLAQANQLPQGVLSLLR